MAAQFVKLHGLSSPNGRKLNGTTARLGLYNHSTQRYTVHTDSRAYMIKLTNMYRISDQWLREVHASPMKGRATDLMFKFDAPAIYPVRSPSYRLFRHVRVGLAAMWRS